MTMAVVDAAITEEERWHLDRCEQVIETGLQTFIEVGLALAEIREGRLYREKYATFEDYCKERWGFSASRARQMISGAQRAEHIKSVTTVTLRNEAQARALTEFDPDLQPAIVKVAAARAEADERDMNSGDIKRVGRVLEEASTTGHVDPGHGKSSAFDAALAAEEIETWHRQRDYIRESQEKRYDSVRFSAKLADFNDSGYVGLEIMGDERMPWSWLQEEVQVIVRLKRPEE